MAKSIVIVSYALLGVAIYREIEMNFILNELSHPATDISSVAFLFYTEKVIAFIRNIRRDHYDL